MTDEQKRVVNALEQGGIIYIASFSSMGYGMTYFRTPNDCREAIATIGDNNFKRYILGIKEPSNE